jgi:hypothetical protein
MFAQGNGASARTRTVNQLIKSQLLYQLSYRGNRRSAALYATISRCQKVLALSRRAISQAGATFWAPR